MNMIKNILAAIGLASLVPFVIRLFLPDLPWLI